LKPKLKLSVIGVILIAIGIGSVVVFQDYQDKQEIQAIQDNQELTTNEKHYQIEQLTKPPEETVQKNFSNNGVEITYEVGIENGIEETPPPDVLVQIQESYTDEQKELNIELNKEFWEARMKILEERLSNSFQAKKQLVDSTFTCDNYNELAYKYQAEALPGFTINGKYDGTFEGYIYWKAFHECIDPKYNEKYDKVMQELEEVNEEN